MWKEAVPDRKGEFEFRAPEELEDLRVEADIHRFQQVLINLLENAVAHSPEPCRVSVEVAATGDGEASVLVRDQGPGIPGENLNRVFEPFFTTRRGGTGLGLSLVKHFVDSMKGKVAVRNNTPLPGCTVEILLPIAGDARS
jgi:two-component system NtrC family sensor kinase